MPDAARHRRVVSVGAGYFAAFHHAAWRDLPGATLVAIVDRDLKKARTAAHGNERIHSTLEEALDAGDIDLVDIVTPPDTHLGLIDTATAADCDVICQKPLCGGLAGAREAVALAASRGATLVVHENFRFQPWWIALKAEIDAGRLGDLYGVAFRLRPGDGQGPRAYLDRQPYFQTMPRLLIHETAVHFVDVFRFLMGEPAWVWADLRRLNPVIAGEDAGLVVFGWQDGRRALFDGNRLADHPSGNARLVMGEALAEGSDATIAIDGDGRVERRRRGETAWTDIPVPTRAGEFGGGGVRALQAHVLVCLAEGRVPENTAADYLRNLEIVEAIYESHKSGNRIMLAPGNGNR